MRKTPLHDAQITEIRKRAETSYRLESPTAERDDVDALLADRDQLVRRLAEAEAELQGLREIATNGPSTASGASPLSHKIPIVYIEENA